MTKCVIFLFVSNQYYRRTLLFNLVWAYIRKNDYDTKRNVTNDRKRHHYSLWKSY